MAKRKRDKAKQEEPRGARKKRKSARRKNCSNWSASSGAADACALTSAKSIQGAIPALGLAPCFLYRCIDRSVDSDLDLARLCMGVFRYAQIQHPRHELRLDARRVEFRLNEKARR